MSNLLGGCIVKWDHRDNEMVDKKRVYWPHITCIYAPLKRLKGWECTYVSDIFHINIYIKLRLRCKYDVKDCPIFDLFYLLGQAEMLLNFTGPRFFFHVVFH